ncbi:tyrosine-protein phosphatase [Streptomyces sp. NPDC001339]|uniref:tyrosine-protein phosphatase n=1 Tax=Streptomyces sp. NPDC001339 TaxID=3364563 RepID=UPI00369F7C9C
MNSPSAAAVLTARRIAVSFVAAISAVGVTPVGTTPPLASADPLGAPTEAGRHAPKAKLATQRLPFTHATVAQQQGGSFTVSWQAPDAGSVTVYAGDKAVAHGGPEATITVRGLPATDRQWFRLAPDQGDPLTLADRSLRLEGAADFHDAGGCRTTDGRWVKMGMLYRTHDLHALTDADLAKLQRLGIRTDASCRRFVSKPSAIDACRSLFRLAGDARSYPLVHHCEGGQDHTVWATAALLTALGVDRDMVIRDCLTTVLDAGAAAYLNASFDKVTARFGTFDAYLRDGLRLSEQDLRRLRAALLTG